MDRVKLMRGEDVAGGVRVASELLVDIEATPPPKHGDNWGRWTLNGHGNHWSLDVKGYFISLNAITSNAQMNDWIFQLAAKTWVTSEDLGNLVLAFDDIFDPQATLCGMGVDKRIAPNYVNQLLGEPLGDKVGDEEADGENNEDDAS